MKKKILITGATGFVGSYLLPILEGEALSVVALTLKPTKSWGKFPTVHADLKNFTQLRRIMKRLQPDTVVHLAAKIPTKNTTYDNNITLHLQQNVVNSMNLIKACRKTIRHFIYISTIDVYGAFANMGIDESLSKNPTTVYGMSKLTAEKSLKLFCDANGITLTILRLSQVYGYGEPPMKVIPLYIKQVLEDSPLTLIGNGEDRRDFLYVKDAAMAILLAIKKQKAGAFNVGAGHSFEVRDVVRIIQKISGKKLRVRRTRRTTEETFQQLRIQNTQKVLGYNPRYTLRTGLQETFKQTAKAQHPVLLVDVDGPILDTKQRHYFVYTTLFKKFGWNPIPRTSFWAKKRERITDHAMIGSLLSKSAHERYSQDKRAMIERPSILQLDRLQPGTLKTLQRLAQQYRIIFITLRQNAKNVRSELERLGALRYAECLHVVSDQQRGGIAKMETVKSCSHFSKHAILIGDTEVDQHTAKLLKISFVAVTNGIRSEWFLRKLHPTKLITSFAQLTKILPSFHNKYAENKARPIR